MIALIKAAAVALFLAAITYGLYRAEAHVEYKGFVRGVDAQKAIDQVVFDKINQELSDAKETAARVYRELANKVLAEAARADAFKSDLEKARAINQSKTNDMARKLAGMRLRFASAAGPEGAGCRTGGDRASSIAPAPPGDAAAASCVLSGPVETAIKLIVFDADTLRDDYKLLYEWAHRDDAR